MSHLALFQVWRAVVNDIWILWSDMFVLIVLTLNVECLVIGPNWLFILLIINFDILWCIFGSNARWRVWRLLLLLRILLLLRKTGSNLHVINGDVFFDHGWEAVISLVKHVLLQQLRIILSWPPIVFILRTYHHWILLATLETHAFSVTGGAFSRRRLQMLLIQRECLRIWRLWVPVLMVFHILRHRRMMVVFILIPIRHLLVIIRLLNNRREVSSVVLASVEPVFSWLELVFKHLLRRPTIISSKRLIFLI